MSLLEQQSALAKLLTDPELRQRFLSEPDAAGRELGLDEHEIEDAIGVAESGLGTFADSLVWKRLREVEKLLPITKRITGDEFRRLFFEFAPSFNPQTVKKHYEDAVGFSRFIEVQDSPGPARAAAKFERTRLTFFNEGRVFAYCLSPYDLTTAGSPVRRRRAAIAIWLRFGKRILHFVI